MKNTFLVSFLFAGTITMIGVMRWHGKSLTQTADTKGGIVALELAKTKQRADEITTTWSNAGLQNHAVTNTYIDFIFIFFYSLFLFSANWLFSARQIPVIKKISQLIALLALTAGFFDIAENFFLLKMLHYNISDTEALITWWLATLKFSLVLLAFLWIMIQLSILFLFKPGIKSS